MNHLILNAAIWAGGAVFFLVAAMKVKGDAWQIFFAFASAACTAFFVTSALRLILAAPEATP